MWGEKQSIFDRLFCSLHYNVYENNLSKNENPHLHCLICSFFNEVSPSDDFGGVEGASEGSSGRAAGAVF